MGALIIIPTMLALCAAFWALLIGVHALLQRRGFAGEYSRLLVLLSVNLCEPAVNGALVMLLFSHLTITFYARPLHALISTLPMAVLIVPAACTSFADPMYWHYRQTLLMLGAARWLVSWGMLTAYLYLHVMSIILLILGTVLLVGCAAWGQTVLLGPLAYPSLVQTSSRERTSGDLALDS